MSRGWCTLLTIRPLPGCGSRGGRSLSCRGSLARHGPRSLPTIRRASRCACCPGRPPRCLQCREHDRGSLMQRLFPACGRRSSSCWRRTGALVMNLGCAGHVESRRRCALGCVFGGSRSSSTLVWSGSACGAACLPGDLHFVPDQGSNCLQVTGQFVGVAGTICQRVAAGNGRSCQAAGQCVSAAGRARTSIRRRVLLLGCFCCRRLAGCSRRRLRRRTRLPRRRARRLRCRTRLPRRRARRLRRRTRLPRRCARRLRRRTLRRRTRC